MPEQSEFELPITVPDGSTRDSPSEQFTYREIMDAFTRYVAEIRPHLESPASVAELMRPVFTGKKQEEFHVLLLDTKHRLLKDEVITVGLVDRTQIHPREIFKAAIKASCSRIILVHGHPSGDPTPSTQDVDSTKQVVAAGKIIGIDVLDHVVIGTRSGEQARDYVSFREENLLHPPSGS